LPLLPHSPQSSPLPPTPRLTSEIPDTPCSWLEDKHASIAGISHFFKLQLSLLLVHAERRRFLLCRHVSTPST
ncbi:hypothetical protein GBAR_LOCUS3266, partial [Geodia barretti]